EDRLEIASVLAVALVRENLARALLYDKLVLRQDRTHRGEQHPERGVFRLVERVIRIGFDDGFDFALRTEQCIIEAPAFAGFHDALALVPVAGRLDAVGRAL